MLNLRRAQTGRPSPASGGALRGVGLVLIACLFATAPACSAGGTGGPATPGSEGSSGGAASGGAAGTGSGGNSAAGSNGGGGSNGGDGSLGSEASDASPDAAPEVGPPGGDAAAEATDASLDVNPTGPNLFMNADFAMGLKGWQTSIAWKGDGITAGAGSALIHADDGVAAERVLDLFQTLMTNGMPYVVSFEFQRRNPQGTRPVQVYCQQADGAKTVFGLATCTIDNTKSICKTACAPPAGAMVSFGVHGGQSFLDFYVDMPSLRQ
jgi:hypothetical protein